MDHLESPAPQPEAHPTPDVPAEKARWSLSDLFKPKDEQGEPKPDNPAKTTAPKGERAEALPEQARPLRFGEAVVKLLGINRAQPEAAPVAPVAEQSETPAADSAPEVQPTLITRAKDMGRNVLRLISGVREDVHQADQQEHVEHPTDTEPLDTAVEQVRAAMEELGAPAEAHQAEYVTDASPNTPSDSTEQNDTPAASADAGGSQRAPESVQRVMNAAELAVAIITATVAERAERPRGTGIIRKLGVLALSGALVYTWHRQRVIKKEQRAQRKQLKRFEAEVRHEQEAAAARIHTLEQTAAEELSQPKRQAYVREVSRFALAQAKEIRSVATFAHKQEHIAPVIAPPVAPLPQPDRQPLPYYQPEIPALPLPPAEQTYPERPPLLPLRKQTEKTPERRSPINTVVERVAELVTGKPPAHSSAAGVSTGGFIGRALGILPAAGQPVAQPGQQPLQPGQQQPPALRPQVTQAWLLGVGLAMGIGLLLLIAMGIL